MYKRIRTRTRGQTRCRPGTASSKSVYHYVENSRDESASGRQVFCADVATTCGDQVRSGVKVTSSLIFTSRDLKNTGRTPDLTIRAVTCSSASRRPLRRRETINREDRTRGRNFDDSKIISPSRVIFYYFSRASGLYQCCAQCTAEFLLALCNRGEKIYICGETIETQYDLSISE